MRDLLGQIEVALDQNLYYLAIFVSLALPDICGAIGSQNGEADKKKYADWFDKYVGNKCYGFLNGEDCYYFRCSLLHQGSSHHPRGTYSRVIFVEPTATTNVFHCNIISGTLNIDVNIFCRDMISGVNKWLHEVETTATYNENYEKFMKRYSDGLPPFIRGVPVIS